MEIVSKSIQKFFRNSSAASAASFRHEDLIFVQNGVLMPFLEEKLKPGLPLTILLVPGLTVFFCSWLPVEGLMHYFSTLQEVSLSIDHLNL